MGLVALWSSRWGWSVCCWEEQNKTEQFTSCGWDLPGSTGHMAAINIMFLHCFNWAWWCNVWGGSKSSPLCARDYTKSGQSEKNESGYLVPNVPCFILVVCCPGRRHTAFGKPQTSVDKKTSMSSSTTLTNILQSSLSRTTANKIKQKTYDADGEVPWHLLSNHLLYVQ